MGIILVGIIALVALTAVDANLFPAKSPDARSGRSGRTGRNRNAQQRLSPRERLRPPTYQDRPVKAFRGTPRQKQSGARWWWEN